MILKMFLPLRYLNKLRIKDRAIFKYEALKYLGVEKGEHHDEFDAVGLGKYRSNPDYLEKYRDLADELGI